MRIVILRSCHPRCAASVVSLSNRIPFPPTENAQIAATATTTTTSAVSAEMPVNPGIVTMFVAIAKVTHVCIATVLYLPIIIVMITPIFSAPTAIGACIPPVLEPMGSCVLTAVRTFSREAIHINSRNISVAAVFFSK